MGAVVRITRGATRHAPIDSSAPALPGGRGATRHPFYGYADSPIPSVTWPIDTPPVPSSASLKQTKKRDPINIAVAAMDAILPIAYGTVMLDALLANVLYYNDHFVVWLIWCEGPIDGFEVVTLGNRALNDVKHHGVAAEITNYTGGTDNVVDPLLVSAYAAQDPPVAFAETLPGVAHSVVNLKVRDFNSAPKFQARVRGRPLYDPRSDTAAFSNNPSLVLADFLVNSCGMAMDWTSVGDAADANDALLGAAPNQEKSRTCDLVLTQPSSLKDWKETMRAAANVFIVENQGAAKLVPDTGGDPVVVYAHGDGQLMSISQPQFPDATGLPTVLQVQYTDTTLVPWADNTTEPAYRAGVDAGLVPWLASTVPMPWIHSRSQALRERTERLNKLWLRGLTFVVELFGEGLRHEVGDIIGITHPEYGFDALPVKVQGVVPTDQGTWSVKVMKEDAGAYSSAVQVNPTTSNTQLPVPTAPPEPTGLSWVEELYLDATGVTRSRLRATWDDVGDSYAYFTGYRVEVYSGATLMGEPTFSQVASLAWGPVQEGLSYTIYVRTTSAIGVSDPATATVTAQGKQLPPGDIPFFQVYESAGDLRFAWVPFSDANNPDTLATELRYGPRLTATWDTAAQLALVPMPARTYETRRVPLGDYRFFAKGRDSVKTADHPDGRESTNAITADVVVSGDPGMFVVDSYVFGTDSAFTAVNMVETADGWLTDFGTAAATLFPLSPLEANYPDAPLISYAGSGTSSSSLTSDEFDFEAPYSGTLQWFGLDYTDVDGAATLAIETSTDGLSWSPVSGQLAQVTARYVRVKIETTGIMVVRSLGSILFSVISLTERGEVNTSASGAVTVNLSRVYSAYQTIQVTADVTSGMRVAGVCNIQVGPGYSPNSFDVKCYDGAGALVVNDVKWMFTGV